MSTSNKKKIKSENDAAEIPRFIVLVSLEETCRVKFSPFLVEKVISGRASSQTDKKTRNGNLLIKVDNRNHAENIHKMKMYHTKKCKAYLN